MTRTRRSLLLAAAAAAGLVLIVLAWHPASVEVVQPRCNPSTYQQEGWVTFIDVEAQTFTVRASNTTDIPVGTVVRPGHNVSTRVIRPGVFRGDVSVTISVDYASDGTDRPATGTLHFPGAHCEQPTTTSTSTTAPPTTTSTSTSVPQSTSTPPPASLVPATTAPPPSAVVAVAAFTG